MFISKYLKERPARGSGWSLLAMLGYLFGLYWSLPVFIGITLWIVLLLVLPLFGVVLLQIYLLYASIRRIIKRQTPWWHAICILAVISITALVAGVASFFILFSVVGFS